MKIDNKNIASQVRLLYAVIPAVIVLSVALIYLLDVASGLLPVIIGGGALAAYAAFAMLMHYNYIMVFVSPEKVIIRYKALWPIRTDNNSIKINAADFAGYTIQKSGLQTHLTIFKNTPGGKAEYPKICINLLDNEDVDKMKRSFALLETIKKRDA